MHPDPSTLYPIAGTENTVFLKPLLEIRQVENVSVGDYTYYSDFNDAAAFFENNVRYNFGMTGATLRIGKFCALAHGATFVMADANHATVGPSTYPFPVFGGSWQEALPVEEVPFLNKGGIEVGHDVWIGMDATIMAGVTIGNGAVIGAKSVVTRDVPDYCIAAGNPATIVKRRYDAEDVERLNRLAWWNWTADVLAEAVPIIVARDVDDLEHFAQSKGLLD